MAGKLSTHILDTAGGKPAAGVAITLHRLDEEKSCIGTFRTDDDGRAILIPAGSLVEGVYEIDFALDEYFGHAHFLSTVTVRFRVSDATNSYHVPLLASPYGYTTYRGS